MNGAFVKVPWSKFEILRVVESLPVLKVVADPNVIFQMRKRRAGTILYIQSLLYIVWLSL